MVSSSYALVRRAEGDSRHLDFVRVIYREGRTFQGAGPRSSSGRRAPSRGAPVMASRETPRAPARDGRDAARATVDELNRLLAAYADSPRVRRVRCRDVVPDGTNREHTGVSLEHAHAIALSMCRDGFDARHETPVVVRTSAAELFASDAYGRWVRFCAENRAATPPPLRADADETRASLMSRALYTTLGSSHLNVALRLVETDTPSVFGADVRLGEALGRDAALRDAVELGLRSVVLTPETPRAARKRVSLLLNRAALDGFEVRAEDGVCVLIDDERRAESERTGPERNGSDRSGSESPRGETRGLSLFQSLSRTLDAEELSALVRIKHGIDLERSQAGYADVSRPGGGDEAREQERDPPSRTRIRARL